MMWWYGPGMNAWGYGLMTVSMVLFWALVIFGIVALIRYIGRSSQPTTAGPTPSQLLDERFARGEIDEEEYRRRLELMSRSSPSNG
jgi:putative membrane protein